MTDTTLQWELVCEDDHEIEFLIATVGNVHYTLSETQDGKWTSDGWHKDIECVLVQAVSDTIFDAIHRVEVHAGIRINEGTKQ